MFNALLMTVLLDFCLFNFAVLMNFVVTLLLLDAIITRDRTRSLSIKHYNSNPGNSVLLVIYLSEIWCFPW